MSISYLDFRSCNMMALVTTENSGNVFVNLSDQLGGLVLKEKKRLAVEALPSGKDVMAVLPTGFGKSLIYQSFLLAKNSANNAISHFIFWSLNNDGRIARLSTASR